MAKKKSSKSEQIREHLKENPEAATAEVAKQFGVSTALVYNAKSSLKKRPRKKARRGRRRSTASRNGAPAQPLVLAARLIKACGSVEEAERALQMVGAVANTLR